MDSIGGVNGELRWAYDLRGRLVADTAYSGTVPRAQAYTYDRWERAHTRTDAVGTWTTRFEGERGLPDTLFTPLGDSLSLGLDPLARVPTLKNVGPTGSGIELVNRNWNVSGALESMDHAVNVFSSPTWTALALERVEAVDSGGPPLGPMWVRQDGPLAVPDTLRDTLAYDGWQRVVSYVLHSSATGHWRLLDLTYSFDAMGNRLTPTGGEVYNATTNQLRVAGSDTLTYDAAGNLSTRSTGQWSYGYDALERLVSVRKGGVLIARYGYDVAGRRIVKRVYNGSTGGPVGYLRMVYAGNQVAFETDSTNTSLSTIYTWGPGIDHLIGVKVGTTAYTAVTDPLGSVRALVRRSDGAWVGRMLYDPYGQLVDSAGPPPALRYRWTGREWDAETGFYFHRTRYYDPTVGRFVQEDQIGYAGSSNLYSYVNGDVLQARDADGLEKEWVDAGGFIPGCMGGSALMGDGSIVAGGCEGAGGRLGALGAWAVGASAAFDMTYSFVTFADGSSALVPGQVARCSDGICPGGLTEAQYERILIAISEEMLPQGAQRVNGFLQQGRVRSANINTIADVLSSAVVYGEVFAAQNPPRTIYLNSHVYGMGDLILNTTLVHLASVLMHEAWHIVELGDMNAAAARAYKNQYGSRMEITAQMHACQQLVHRAQVSSGC